MISEMATVRVAGIDITADVVSVQSVPFERPDWGEVRALPSVDIEVANIGHTFSPFMNGGFLHNRRLESMSLTIDVAGRRYWSGNLENIAVDMPGHKATLTGQSELQYALNQPTAFIAGSGTPSLIAAELLRLYNVPLDPFSFNASHSLYAKVGIYATVSPDLEGTERTPLIEVLKMLATAGVARCYSLESGVIAWDAFQTGVEGAMHQITDGDIMQLPRVEDESRDALNGVSVRTRTNTVASGDIDGGKTQQHDFGPEAMVRLEDDASGFYCASQWLTLLNREYYRMTLYLAPELAETVKVKGWLSWKSERMGGTFAGEIIRLDNGDGKWLETTIRLAK